MAYNLCHSTSSLFVDRHPLFHSLSSTSKPKPRPFTFLFHSKPFLQKPYVSLQETPNHIPTKDASSSNSYIWVNPRSPRASKLKKKSYDSRYTSLVKVAEALNVCSANEDSVFSILSCLGDEILEQDCVVIINNMWNPDTALLALKYFQNKLKASREVILYNVTLKVLRKNRDLDKAEKLFEEMLEKGIKPDNVTFSTVIGCARMCDLPGKAVELFEKMPSYGCEPDDVTFSAMIDVYGRAGNVDMALSLYDRARDGKWRIDPMTFSTLIKMYGMSGNFDGCLNVYEEMKALGVKPNMIVYNNLLDAMGRAKRRWQAKDIFKDMTSNGYWPNWKTCIFIAAYGRSRYGEDALAVYREMKKKGLELNVILYNTILAVCADLGYTDEAFKIFEDMRSSGTCNPGSWTFSSLITLCSCSGKVSEAEVLLNEMLEAGFDPNIFLLTSLIQCYGNTQSIDDVLRTFNRMPDLSITPDDRFCGCLLSVMTQTRKEEFSKLTECIEKANLKLGNVVKLLLEEEGIEGDFKMEAFELLNSISNDVKKAYCSCLIDFCVNLNLVEKACELPELGLTLEI